MNKRHNYSVFGRWPFPLDMLRYDGSEPLLPEDRDMIERLSGDHAASREDFQDVEIKLIGPNKPNTARWVSFGWRVPEDKEYELHRVLKKQAAERERLARISAAGPLLLEALEELLSWVPKSGNGSSAMQSSVQKAERALRAAKGKL